MEGEEAATPARPSLALALGMVVGKKVLHSLIWLRSTALRIQHVNTESYLTSAPPSFNIRPIDSTAQFELQCVRQTLDSSHRD